jgi:alpha 1,2-mannosyltransferase
MSMATDILSDPFTFMRENKKRYSFIIALPEFGKTIPTLWSSTRSFVKKFPQLLAKDNILPFIIDDKAKGIDGEFNNCHFWSNFEIADLDFWRSEVCAIL